MTVVVPARNEEANICSMVEHLDLELRLNAVPHEILVVDDGSTDQTWTRLLELSEHVPALHPIQNLGQNGFGRAIVRGLDHMHGDAVVIMMANPTTLRASVVTSKPAS